MGQPGNGIVNLGRIPVQFGWLFLYFLSRPGGCDFVDAKVARSTIAASAETAVTRNVKRLRVVPRERVSEGRSSLLILALLVVPGP